MTEKLYEKIIESSVKKLEEKGAKPEDIVSVSPQAFVEFAKKNSAQWLNHRNDESGERIKGNLGIGRTMIPVEDEEGNELSVALNYRINRKTGEAVYYSSILMNTPILNYGGEK